MIKRRLLDAFPSVPTWAALFCASLVLRPPLAAVGPLIPQMQRGLGISHAAAGLVPATLLLSMGLSSLGAPAIVRRLGWFRGTTAALVVIGAAGVGRAIVPSIIGVIVLSVPIGVGAGLGGASLPTAVGDIYRSRGAAGTAIHALGINFGATAAAALAVPLAVLLGGWRCSLGCLALAGVSLSVLWEFGARTHRERAPAVGFVLPVGDLRAWMLTCLFALQGLCYYGFSAWLSDAYVERGWSQSAGGGLVAAMTAAAVPASFVVPRASERTGGRVRPLVICTLVLLVGSVALVAWPSAAWPGAALVGVALGGVFSLCLLLAVDLGGPSHQVSGFAGMMLGLGYTVSAAAPVLLGVVRDAFGSFSTALWLMVIIAAGLLALLAVARRLLSPVTGDVAEAVAMR